MILSKEGAASFRPGEKASSMIVSKTGEKKFDDMEYFFAGWSILVDSIFSDDKIYFVENSLPAYRELDILKNKAIVHNDAEKEEIN